jgi:hypothetical protein
MKKNNASHLHFTPYGTSESGSESKPKTASNTNVPLSVQPLIAYNTLFLVIFMCLAEKDVLSFSQAARLLEEVTNEKPDLPDGARAWPTQMINTLWNFDKNTASSRHIIH